jgi:SAM-dependent methyltransferase
MPVMQAESYRGRHADFYDIFYAEKPYHAEAATVAKLFGGEPRGKRLLDLACGTGRHATEFGALGFEVTGLDLSSDMIRVARERTKAMSGITVRTGDMRALDFSSETFDCVTCLFDSIGYLLDNVSIRCALSEAHRVLKSGGTFVSEFWHAPAMARGFDPHRTRKFNLPGGEIVRISTTTLDPVHQTATVEYEISELDLSGTLKDRFTEVQRNRFFQCQEFALFLEIAGFVHAEFFPAFSLDKSIELDSWHILAVMRKP